MSKERLLKLINEEWFFLNGTVEPTEAYLKWQTWLRKRSLEKRSFEQMRNKALQLAIDVSSSTILNYFHTSDVRRGRMARCTEIQLNSILTSMMAMLEKPADPRTLKPFIPSKSQNFNKRKRVALFTELSEVPSFHYHKTLLASCLRGANKLKLHLSIHEASQSNLARKIKQTLIAECPDGVLIIRLNPLLPSPIGTPHKLLKSASVPTVLIHAPRNLFQAPIVTNFVSVIQESTIQDFRRWLLKRIPESLGRPKAVLVHMQTTSDLLEHRDMHRLNRIQVISQTLSKIGFDHQSITVPDYSFHHAFSIFEQHKDAQVFVCLSDQIAIALSKIFKMTGSVSPPLISGFDDSDLARKSGIPSFGQQLEEIGDQALQFLENVITKQISKFQQTPIDTYFRH